MMFRMIFGFAVGYMVGVWGKAWLLGNGDDLSDEHLNDDEKVEASGESTVVRAEADEADEEEVAAEESVTDSADLSADDLTKIKGIGKVFAQRLIAGGVIGFVQLASADSALIHDLLQVKEWQKVDIKDWQAQARELISS